MSAQRASDLGRDEWEPSEILTAQQGLEQARRAHASATDARALAVYRARRKGATLVAIGQLLGIAHKNVSTLERRGERLAAECAEFGCHEVTR